MRGEAYKLCPACEARNRARWEFCVRCGEPLHDVEPVRPEAEAIQLGPVAVSPGAALGGLVGAIVIVVGTYALVPKATPAQPDPNAFPPLTAPPPLPSPSPAWPPPGQKQMREARNLLLGGDANDALSRAAQAVAEAPQSAQAHNLYAHALWQTGDRDAALAQYRIAVQLADPRTVGFRADLAKALASAGRAQEAAVELEEIVKAVPRNGNALRDLSALYLQLGRDQESIDTLRKAIEVQPRNADLQEQLGFVLEKSGRTEEALAAYEKALEIYPTDAKLTRLVELMGRQGKEAEALALVQRGVRSNPGSPVLQRGLARALERAGKIPEAVAAYREYVRLAPDAPDAAELEQRAAALEQGGRATS